MANDNDELRQQQQQQQQDQRVQQQSMDDNSPHSSPSPSPSNGNSSKDNGSGSMSNNNEANACDSTELIVGNNVLTAGGTAPVVDNVNSNDNATATNSDDVNISMATTTTTATAGIATGAMRKTMSSNATATPAATGLSSSPSLSLLNNAPSTVLVNNCARSQLTDLVADVCLNGAGTAAATSNCDVATTLPIGFGDCTNIRATRYGLYDFNEGDPTRRSDNCSIERKSTAQSTNTTQQQQQQQQHQHQHQPQSSSSPTVSATSSSSPPPALQPTTAPAQNSSTFSFKHFLSSSSSTFTAPSTTVTSLDPICSVASSSAAFAASAATTTTSTTSTSNGNTPKSTGARPKVPQSASLAIDSIVGGGGGGLGVPSSGDNGGFASGNTRMKRSPRFSSFDSQASLAEYAANGRNVIGCGGGSGDGVGCDVGSAVDDSNIFPGNSNASGFRLYPLMGSETNSLSFAQGSKRNSAAASNSSSLFSAARQSAGSDNCNRPQQQQQQQQQQYVPRSYSSYEMPMQPPMSPSPRRRMVDAVANVAAAGTSSASNRPNRLSLHPTNASKLKLDLPIDSIAANVLGPSDFPPASAAALPDFVQDHWMEALYLHDMHLNSPRNSPTRDFVGAAAAAASAAAWSDFGAVGGACGGGNSNPSGNNVTIGGLAAAGISNFEAQCLGAGGDDISGIPGPGSNGVPSTTGPSKMLPDFLSDGPIIHSSQRLADVAAGLPSNSIGSPEDPPITSQLSNLRLENERLQRELSETRAALCEQTRRANDLERQLQEENRRRAATPTAQQVIRLKQQLAEMAEEAEILRRENEALREDGAVGGFSDNAAGQRGGADGRFVRPVTSRSQQISQALLRAASNAESNLRQLLAGVDNLRQMAADIEDPTLRVDYDGSSDIFSDFLDECDCFDDFSGGPAL